MKNLEYVEFYRQKQREAWDFVDGVENTYLAMKMQNLLQFLDSTLELWDLYERLAKGENVDGGRLFGCEKSLLCYAVDITNANLQAAQSDFEQAKRLADNAPAAQKEFWYRQADKIKEAIESGYEFELQRGIKHLLQKRLFGADSYKQAFELGIVDAVGIEK